MTNLYRGLLLLLSQKFDGLNSSMRTHIRGFKQETNDPENYLDIGVMGFWNLMLEIVFTLYTIVCLTTGIALIAIMAVIFYPFEAFLNFVGLILKNTRNPTADSVKVTPLLDESPVIVKKKNDKEKV